MKKAAEINKDNNIKNNFSECGNSFIEKSTCKKPRKIILTIICLAIFFFIIIPFVYTIFTKEVKLGNVARISINGPIMNTNEGFLGRKTVSLEKLKEFIQEAEDNKGVKVILLEINSPGGAPVASEEVAKKVKKVTKPVIVLINVLYWQYRSYFIIFRIQRVDG